MTSITQPLKVYQSHGMYPKPLDCGQKWLFEKIMVDSSVEEKFWEWFQKDITIEFFFKINDINFKIKTPVGQFTPDRWVVVKKQSHDDTDAKEIYFVVENKWSRSDLQLKTVERIKIACAKKHFSILKSSLKSWFLECDRYDKYDEFKRELGNI
jgi:type III restriction enzyme